MLLTGIITGNLSLRKSLPAGNTTTLAWEIVLATVGISRRRKLADCAPYKRSKAMNITKYELLKPE
jgi:hypothetical protein